MSIVLTNGAHVSRFPAHVHPPDHEKLDEASTSSSWRQTPTDPRAFQTSWQPVSATPALPQSDWRTYGPEIRHLPQETKESDHGRDDWFSTSTNKNHKAKEVIGNEAGIEENGRRSPGYDGIQSKPSAGRSVLPHFLLKLPIEWPWLSQRQRFKWNRRRSSENTLPPNSFKSHVRYSLLSKPVLGLNVWRPNHKFASAAELTGLRVPNTASRKSRVKLTSAWRPTFSARSPDGWKSRLNPDRHVLANPLRDRPRTKLSSVWKLLFNVQSHGWKYYKSPADRTTKSRVNFSPAWSPLLRTGRSPFSAGDRKSHRDVAPDLPRDQAASRGFTDVTDSDDVTRPADDSATVRDRAGSIPVNFVGQLLKSARRRLRVKHRVPRVGWHRRSSSTVDRRTDKDEDGNSKADDNLLGLFRPHVGRRGRRRRSVTDTEATAQIRSLKESSRRTRDDDEDDDDDDDDYEDDAEMDRRDADDDDDDDDDLSDEELQAAPLSFTYLI